MEDPLRPGTGSPGSIISFRFKSQKRYPPPIAGNDFPIYRAGANMVIKYTRPNTLSRGKITSSERGRRLSCYILK